MNSPQPLLTSSQPVQKATCMTDALPSKHAHPTCAAVNVLTCRLAEKGAVNAAGGGGSELPKLEVDGAAMRKTDERGRAYFGDVGIGEGSGRVAPDENTGVNRQGGAMELILVAEVAGLGDADAKCVLIGQYSYHQKDRCAVKLHS